MSVYSTWTRIERWLQANAPAVLRSLRIGATDAEIYQAEQQLDVILPDDVRDFYRRHNGQSDPEIGLIEGRAFLSLEQIVDWWRMWKDLLDGQVFLNDRSAPCGQVRDDWWNARWIPLTDDGSGNHYCVDLAPPEGGIRGQIITMWHDDPIREIVAPNFASWLIAFADALEQDAYVYLPQYGALRRSDDV